MKGGCPMFAKASVYAFLSMVLVCSTCSAQNFVTNMARDIGDTVTRNSRNQFNTNMALLRRFDDQLKIQRALGVQPVGPISAPKLPSQQPVKVPPISYPKLPSVSVPKLPPLSLPKLPPQQPVAPPVNPGARTNGAHGQHPTHQPARGGAAAKKGH